MFTQNDLNTLQALQISEEKVMEQLNRFRTGFPFLEIKSAAGIGNGIMKVSPDEMEEYLKEWDLYRSKDQTIVKFVPASGAASRMFKDLFAMLEADYDTPQTQYEKTFFENIDRFAFYNSLNGVCRDVFGKNVPLLIESGQYKSVLHCLLSSEGLNYGNLPKGLLLFHRYSEGNRTPVGEHLSEGVHYAQDAKGVVRIHFTVSPEHLPLFELLVAARRIGYEQKLDATFDITYSIQKRSTDTIAATEDNEPFRDENNELLFRPGGHGALIENLNGIDANVVFIKNIDNVVPDRLKEEDARYKKMLGGILVNVQRKAFNYLQKLETKNYTDEELTEMLDFTKEILTITPSKVEQLESLPEYLHRKLNRPFRVCGMVKNEGEPGGGPFIAKNSDGSCSLQILESSQIDPNNPAAVDAFKNGSHFNPVDLVCGLKNYKGEKFNLTTFVDAETGFISQKSRNGKELKALELPGLWNGAMSDWNTLFVEVPISTFNPVKTVNDLLRPEHSNRTDRME